MRVASFALYAAAALLLAIAAWLGFEAAMFVNGADRVAGEVDRIDVVESPQGVLYVPAIRYLGRDNEPHEVAGPGESHASTFGPGDRVDVYRHAGPPPRAELVGRQGSQAVVAAVMGCIFAAIAALVRMADRDIDAPRLVGTFFLGFGALMLFGALASTIGDIRFLTGGVHVVGEVTNGRGVTWTLLKEPGSGQLPAVVRLRTPEGREIELTDPQFDATYVKAGAPVQVVYTPGRPHAGRVRDGASFWLGDIILGGFGALMTAVGVFSLRFARRRS